MGVNPRKQRAQDLLGRKPVRACYKADHQVESSNQERSAVSTDEIQAITLKIPDRVSMSAMEIFRQRCRTDSCPPRKFPVLCGHFHLFALFDEKGNADFQACLQLSCLGPAARRVAPNRGFGVGNLQLNEYW